MTKERREQYTKELEKMNKLAKEDILAAILYSERTSLVRDMREVFAKSWTESCKGKKNSWKLVDGNWI